MSTNNFLPFCNTDTGTNLPTQGDYLVDPNRDIGAQPGIASSKLNNKPIRQATAITSQIAQYIANKTATDVLDDGNMTKLLAQINAAIYPLPQTFTTYTSGSGTHNITYWFFIASGSATAGATYTNNAVTFTVKATVASATLVSMSGSGAPAVSGTLTKASGTGDATLSFYAVRAPLSLIATLVGGGGGGEGSGTTSPNGGNGGDTTFGSSLLTANGGVGGGGGASGGSGEGGAFTINSPAVGFGFNGSAGDNYSVVGATVLQGGASGGCSFFGGTGKGGVYSTAGYAGSTNSGSGGGGGGVSGSASNPKNGSGGGAGGYLKATIVTPSSSYAYAVGAAGTAGTAGTSGFAGGDGAAGIIIVEEFYQ